MSGHSKWSQIKHKKGISDQKKGKLFSKLSKLITIAAKDNPDPAGNIKLQTAIEHAKAENMPKENIERAVSRSKDKDSLQLKEIVIYATGPESTAFIIKAITDNSNRTIQELKKLFTEYNFKMAAEGSLDWMFENNAEHTPKYPIEITDEATRESLDLLMNALDDHDDIENVYTNITDFSI